MTPEEVRDAIIEKLYDNWTETEVAWPNRDFDGKTHEKYIRLSIKYGDAYEGEKGTTGIGFRPGVVMIDVFTPKNEGDSLGCEYAGDIEDIFRRAVLEDYLVMGEASTKDIGPEAKTKFYHHQVQIPFTAFIGE